VTEADYIYGHIMVAYLTTNKTPRRYFGSALILTFPPKRKNPYNPYSHMLFVGGMWDSWMRFGLAMVDGGRAGSTAEGEGRRAGGSASPNFS
jgi:hypothetical protein